MQPDARARAAVGDGPEGIDRAGVGGAGGRHDRHRRLVALGERRVEAVEAHPKGRVGGDDHRLAEAEELHRLGDGAVGLARHEDPAGALHLPGRREAGEVGHRAPAGEEPAGGVGQATRLAEPIEGHLFEHVRSGRLHEVAEEGVEAGGQRVGEHGDEIARRGDEAEEARVAGRRRRREHVAEGALEDLGRVPPLPREHLGQPRSHALAPLLRGNRGLGQPRPSFHQSVDHAVAEGAHRLGVQGESVAVDAVAHRQRRVSRRTSRASMPPGAARR